MSEIRFEIGEVVLGLVFDDDQDHFPIEESYRKFISTDLPLVSLHHSYGDPPDLSSWQPVFDSTGVWRLFRQGDRLAIGLYSPVYGPRPYQVTVVSSDFLTGSIMTSATCFRRSEIPFPLRYPLAEVLMIHLLAQGRGILLHACAVKDGEQGILFSGVSGAGKSTTAWLWENQPGAILLSDDRVILHRQANGFNIYGTPWHGDARAAAQVSAPLEKIFILRHATKNYITPLSSADLATRLLVRAFPTFWDPAGMAFSLQLLDELSQAVPGYELGFLPDQSAVDFVRSL